MGRGELEVRKGKGREKKEWGEKKEMSINVRR